MKQQQIIHAYNTLGKLSTMQFPAQVSYEIYMLMKKLESTYKFAIEFERKLVGKYNGTIAMDGLITFPNQEDTIKFRDELTEANEIEVNIDFEPVVVSYAAFGEQTVTPMDIANLSGFLKFE